MHVLILNQYFPPDASATARLLGELVEDLADAYDVSVVSGQPSYNAETGANPPAGVRVTRVRSTAFARSSMIGRLANYATFLASATGRAIVTRPSPDVIAAFTDPPVIGLIGAIAAWRHQAGFVYVSWDIFPDVGIALGRVNHPVVVMVLRAINRFVRRRADVLVAVGRDMRAKLIAQGADPEKVVVIPHWAPDVRPSAAAIAAGRTALAPGDEFIVMHAGNAGIAQNLGLLLDAAEELRSDARVRFVVLGDGAARPDLQADAIRRGLHNVKFMSYRRQDAALPLMGAADLHVVSLAPGLKGSVVASKVYGLLALGQPFVAAVDEGSEIDLLVRETGAGVRISPGDGLTLAAHIREFVDGKQIGEDLGRRGRAAFEESYRRPIATAKYRAVLVDAGAARGVRTVTSSIRDRD